MLVTSTKTKLKPIQTVLNHPIDWFSTVLDLANVDNRLALPTAVDGISLAHTIRNPNHPVEKEKTRNSLIIGVWHQFSQLKKYWEIQYAVIYKGKI